MGKRYTSRPNLIGGGFTTYDERGKKVSRSEPNFFGGGYTTYDAHGKKIGRSEPNLFGAGYTHYDARGHKTGRSEPNLFGAGYTTYDRHGHKTGRSEPNFFGSGFKTYDTRPSQPGAPRSSGGGCYIATCVYGTYDAPEVMTLRRFRDETLQKSVFGRAFIRCYYTISPRLVKHFGQRKWFRDFWKKHLDKMVESLEHSPAKDKPQQ